MKMYTEQQYLNFRIWPYYHPVVQQLGTRQICKISVGSVSLFFSGNYLVAVCTKYGKLYFAEMEYSAIIIKHQQVILQYVGLDRLTMLVHPKRLKWIAGRRLRKYAVGKHQYWTIGEKINIKKVEK